MRFLSAGPWPQQRHRCGQIGCGAAFNTADGGELSWLFVSVKRGIYALSYQGCEMAKDLQALKRFKLFANCANLTG